MRKFLLNTLNKLDKLAGLRQVEKLMASQDPKKEINDLLDELCKVCGMFSYIPDDNKETIITESILTDPDFIGLNSKVLFKWFDKVKGIYFAQSTEQIKVPEDYKPVTGEDRDKWIAKWMKELQHVGQPDRVEQTGPKIKSSLANLSELPAMEKRYTPPTAEYIYAQELHTQYLRENYDAITGKQKAEWISEKRWLELNQ